MVAMAHLGDVLTVTHSLSADKMAISFLIEEVAHTGVNINNARIKK